MLTIHRLRELNLDPATHPRGQPHLSAASGLAQMHGKLFVVADDEHHLGILDAESATPVRLLRLLPGDLPASAAGRKSVKPDFESLLALPAMPGYARGALLVLGSGSRPNRCLAVLIDVDEHEDLTQPPRVIDLQPLYAPLSGTFETLNIEGAFIAADALHLLQRANRSDKRNACIAFDWNRFVAWLLGLASASVPVPVPVPVPIAIRYFDLGAVDGVPFGFTDAAALPGGAWIFSAVAEDTDDAYADGACKGSAIGVVDALGRLCWMQPLDPPCKVEGIAAQVDGDLLALTLVTDADDPAIATSVYSATLSLSESLVAAAAPAAGLRVSAAA